MDNKQTTEMIFICVCVFVWNKDVFFTYKNRDKKQYLE